MQVLKTFALSRVYYVASIIPLPKSFEAKFVKLMGKFLWSSTGKILRVAMDDIRNLIERGGLGLTCLRSMSVSLLLSQ